MRLIRLYSQDPQANPRKGVNIMKAKTFVVIAAALLLVAVIPSAAGAYGKLTHEWVVLQGFDLFKCPGPEPCACPQHYYPELEQPLNISSSPYPWWYYPPANLFTSQLIEGGGADAHSHVFDFEVVTGSHFWDADDSDELVESYMPFTGYYPNSMDEARRTLKIARELYLNGDKTAAYDYLAHVLHAIGDMTVPAHAHVNPHALNGLDADAGDSYDDWCGLVGNESEETDTFSKNHGRWTSDHARAAGGLVTIPENAQSVYAGIVEGNNDGLWPPAAPGADFYYLIYTANQFGDYYGSMGFIPLSGDGDGDADDSKHSWMNYGAPPFTNVDDPPLTQDRLLDNSRMLYCTPSPICPFLPETCPLSFPSCWQFWGSTNDDDGDLSKIASTNLVYAYRAAASIIKSFRDSIDTVPPLTEIALEGTAGHDGWYRSDVLMNLNATDETSPDYMMTQWRYAAATGYCWFPYAGPFIFDSEGIKDITYRSIDGLGVEENPSPATIKIDKTPPVVTVTSPQHDGFYLTSDTLTLDFSVFDALSQVYSFSANLDGTPVSDGQVFDLDNMGGWHTLYVEAEDFAGNRSYQSVEFSIKIHATINHKPDTLNDKSSGNPVTVYIEFPAGYDVNLITVQTVHLKYSGWFLDAADAPTEVKDYDHDKVADRMVKFSRQDFITALGGDTGNVSIIVDGQLIGGTEFYGTGPVEVISPPK